MNGFDDTDAALLERAGTALAVLFLGGAAVCIVGWLLAGCTPEAAVPVGIEGAAFRAELAECRERSSTCPGYVACRTRVEAAHGRTYRGRCEP
jgi:hypothetical protein